MSGVQDGDDAAAVSDTVDIVEVRRTNRWAGLVGATLAAAVLALLARSAGLLLVAGLGATLVAYERVAAPPPAAIALDRRFDPVDPGVGESVTVELTIANVGDRTIADLRVADGVPDGVRVTDGDARIATALRPGAATTIEYAIAGGSARRSFTPAHVAVRDVVGLVERRARVEAGADALAWPSLRPESALSLLPPRFGPVGRLKTGESGEGLAFHSVREHRPEDPLRRIDWRRRARTGELATVEFHREQVAAVVVLLDARVAAAVAPGPDAETAVERSVAAASALVEGIEAAGHRVGLAALGPADYWIGPDRGPAHRERLQRRLADDGGLATGADGHGHDEPTHTDGADSEAASDDRSAERAGREAPEPAATDGVGGGLERVLARLDPETSVVLLSPLCDAASAAIPRRLAARVRSLSVVSPDPTAADSPGQRLVRLERAERLRSLRALDVQVVDWSADRSLEHLLAGMEGKS